MENIVKTEQLYEGKAKKVFATNDPDLVIVDYKDDATAFNGEKKGTIVGKGAINNKMTNYMFKLLEKEGIPTHLVEEISDRETIVKKVEIVPLEVIVRNVAAGSFSKKLGIEEGTKLKQPTLEFSYKCDELGDPFINKYYALGLGLATEEEIEDITKYAFKADAAAKAIFAGGGNSDDMPSTTIAAADLTDGKIGILTLLVKCGLCPSNGEARRLVTQNGIAVNGEKFTDPKGLVDLSEPVVIKKGKKIFHKAIAE